MIDYSILEIVLPALIVGIMVALTHGLLGIKVLERGIIFIDLAIAQIAGFGLLLANLLMPEFELLQQIMALLCAVIGACFFYYIERKIPELEEAIIGCSFVLTASLSILLLANHPHGGDEIKALLSGQILFVSYKDILTHAPIYLIIIALWFVRPVVRNGIWFYLIFAFAITSSVQLVGVYLVFASLILPAIAAWNKPNKIKVAWMCGVISVVIGLVIATVLDLPAGGVIVLAYAVVAFLFFNNAKS